MANCAYPIHPCVDIMLWWMIPISGAISSASCATAPSALFAGVDGQGPFLHFLV